MFFVKKSVFTNFTKLTRKHLCQNLFFNKVESLRPATFLKKKPWYRCFPVNFVKFLRTPFFTEHLWWLLLEIANADTIANLSFRFKSRTKDKCISSNDYWGLKRLPETIKYSTLNHWNNIFEKVVNKTSVYSKSK